MVMDKKRIFSIVLIVIGIITLGCGIAMLIIKLNEKPKIAEGEYLIGASEWRLENGEGCADDTTSGDASKTMEGSESVEASEVVEIIDTSETVGTEEVAAETEQTSIVSDCNNESGVIWKFVEIGKGALTTNNHLNDYDFQWTIKDGKLIIKTAWLYELINEYDYSLDQQNGLLTLQDPQGEYRFVAQTE